MSEESEPIILSSDEESPPKKKIKSSLMTNLLGVTITPITKEKQLKSVCLISDEDDNDSEPEVQEIVDDTKIQTKVNNITYNEEMINKNNEDCEIVSIKNATEVIDITNLESTETEEVNGNQAIETKETDENFDFVSDKNTEQIIDITENNEENENSNCAVINEPTENNTSHFITGTHLENGVSSIDVELTLQKDDLLIAKSETSVPCVEALEESNSLSSNNLIENFLEICTNMLVNTEYNLSKQFEMLKQYYKKCEPKLIECEEFKKLIENNLKKAELTPDQAVISFGEVFKHVKDLVEVNTVEVSKKKKTRLKKLEFAIKQLVSKIKELENEEVDFDDEEDSSFLKLERYLVRLNKLYLKYCQYLKTNPHAGRITYTKLNFVDSKYNEINRAISKKYKDNKKFPSYYEMELFIKNVLKQNNMELSDAEIKTESEHCFKKLGELLQTRRKRELYENHSMYIQDTAEDPASHDRNLKAVLETNFRKAQNEIEKLCQEYVVKQNVGLGNIDNSESESSENENGDTT